MNLYVSIILSNFGSDIFERKSRTDIKSHIKSTMIGKWNLLKSRMRAEDEKRGEVKSRDDEYLLLNDAHVDPNSVQNVLKSQGDIANLYATPYVLSTNGLLSHCVPRFGRQSTTINIC